MALYGYSYIHIYNKIGERIPYCVVGEKGTHLPVVGHIFQREKERERDREIHRQ